VSVSGAGFSVSGVSTGQVIGAGKTATLNAQFAPASTGSVTGSATISSDASNSPSAVSLSGAGVQLVTHSTNLSWSPSSSTVMGYNVYSSNVSGGPYTKLTSSPLANMTYKDGTVQSGKTYYYVVTSVTSSNMESTYSNQVAAAIP
jgi:fibronectin type 3 domain-containing protein